METGRSHDPDTGLIVPAHYIERLIVAHNGRVIIETRLSTAVSRNPHLSFEFRGGSVGDTIRVSWQDNRGRSDQQDTLIRTSDTR
jgi:sulfur-oxidizing protein SoxZ